MEIKLGEIAKKATPIIKHLNLDTHKMAHFLIHYTLKDFKPEDYKEFSMWGITEETLIEDLESLIKLEM